MKVMMANIRILVLFLSLLLASCGQKSKGVYIPSVNKSYLNVLDLENDSLQPNFVQYMGFTISIDSLYLERGYIDQNLDLGDISNDALINKYKIETIQEIKFVGDSINTSEFEQRYGLSLKNVGDFYEVYNQQGINIGHLKIDKQSYEFVVKSI